MSQPGKLKALYQCSVERGAVPRGQVRGGGRLWGMLDDVAAGGRESRKRQQCGQAQVLGEVRGRHNPY